MIEFYVSDASDSVSTERDISLLKFLALVDSGSTDCFIDSHYVLTNNIPTLPITSINLCLFDGSLATSPITHITTLPIRFPSSELLDLDFYVTPLDSSCKAVLGYNFLRCYNPLVDWSNGKLLFREFANSLNHFQTSNPVVLASPNQDSHWPLATITPQPLPVQPPKSRTPRQEKKSKEKFPFEPIYTYPSVVQMASVIKSSNVDIRLLGAAAFLRVCQESRCEPLLFHAVHSEVSARFTASTEPSTSSLKPKSAAPDIPKEYAEFAKVFDKVKADILAEHHPYDLKIELEEGKEPPLAPIYPLSPCKQEALKEFLDEHISTGFILHPTRRMVHQFSSFQRKTVHFVYASISVVSIKL